jgi:hypothetical protein
MGFCWGKEGAEESMVSEDMHSVFPGKRQGAKDNPAKEG